MFLETAIHETTLLLMLILPKMFVGMVAATIIFSIQKVRDAANKMTKLTDLAHLKSGVAVVAFFTSKVVGLSVLAEMYKEKMIDGKEVIIASIIGMFPLSIRAIALIMGPVALSSLGTKLGTIYCALELTSKFFIMILGIYLGKKFLDGSKESYEVKTSLKDNLVNTLKHFVRISIILAITIFLVSLVLSSGFIKIFGLNAKTPQVVIVLAGTGSTIAGFGTAGLLLSKGQISESSAMLALMIAMIFHRVIEVLRFSFPLNVSLFGPRLGTRLTFALFLVGEIACILNITILLVLIKLGIV